MQALCSYRTKHYRYHSQEQDFHFFLTAGDGITTALVQRKDKPETKVNPLLAKYNKTIFCKVRHCTGHVDYIGMK